MSESQRLQAGRGRGTGTGTGKESFPFRPWVRRSCRRALVWGLGVLVVVAAVAWWFRGPATHVWSTAFGVLAAYGLLFLATLLKIWWTAGRPAVILDEDAIFYQPLWAFRPRRVPYAKISEFAPRPGTQSLRFLLDEDGDQRELFLNLGVVARRHELLERLEEKVPRLSFAPQSR